MKNYLSSEVKRYIVRGLACHDTPSEVSRSVLAEFGLEVSRMAVQKYDPTRYAGRRLSLALRQLFESTRKQFLDELETLPLAHRSVRLRKLGALYETAEEQGHLKAAISVLGLAQREMMAFELVEVPDGDPTTGEPWNTPT